MTEQAPEDFTGSDDGGWGEATGANAPAFPELPSNPHNHRFTISLDGRGPMVVVRGNTAQEIKDGFAELEQTGFGAYIAAFWAPVEAAKRGGAPAPQAPAQQPWQQQPAQPFPNQPYPNQPAWQQAGASQAPAPQWGGGAPQGGAPAGNRQGPKPRPNWPQVYKVNVPFNGKDAFKAFREQNKDVLKGKVAWAGGGDYWVEGSVVQGFAQWNPVAA